MGSFGGTTRLLDANQNVAATMTGLQNCARQFNTTTSQIAHHRGWRWADGVTGFTMFNTILTPNDQQFRFGGCRDGCGPGCNMDDGFVYGASSAHSGGVNVLMADGSVRFVKDSVSRPTWWALGTRSNGETVSSDAY
jgi:prepilin-type processing-associated H-X9-DG protein